MSDITFTRGYGFPRGSGMDYAGYAGAGRGASAGRMNGLLVDRQPRGTFRAPPYVPEASIFSKIPALDGLGEDFGTEYTLPVLDLSPGAPDPSQQPGWGTDVAAAAGGHKVAVAIGVGLGLWWLFGGGR